VIEDADVILAVGTRFASSGARENQAVVHVDVDADEIGRHFSAALPVVGDAAPALEQLLTALQKRGDPRPSRAAETRAMRARVEEELRAVGPQAAMVEVLRAAVPDDAILVPCTTTIGYMCHMHYRVYEPRTYLSTSYMGTLGFAFPAALGAKVGRPDRPVVCVSGDGGFLFAGTELATAVQHGINVVTVVYNDNAYGNSNRDQRERFHGREIGTVLHNPDFAKFAQSFGADGVKLDSADQLVDALPEAIANNRPTVIEVPMDRLPSPF
jgi:acetolactate synthase I/II/III large subunit